MSSLPWPKEVLGLVCTLYGPLDCYSEGGRAKWAAAVWRVELGARLVLLTLETQGPTILGRLGP
jgi:hypothetical protein